MQRPPRKLARLRFAATTVSLILSLTLGLLGIRSYTVDDRALWTRFRRLPTGAATAASVDLHSSRGRFWLTTGTGHLGRPGDVYWDEYYRQADATAGRPRLQFFHHRPTPADTLLTSNPNPDAGTSGWGPFRWQSWGQAHPALPVTAIPVTQHNTRIALPHWLPAALFALPPALAATRRLRRRRSPHAPHLCPTCHYDLRATPHRCPECGTLPNPQPASPTQAAY